MEHKLYNGLIMGIKIKFGYLMILKILLHLLQEDNERN